ncbi:MAG: hypothetical protein RJA20_1101, partial [Bacteroidota bacterium]
MNYTSTYGYAIAGSLNGCTDTDGDGVPDLLDIDDDNDGVPDAEENAACDNRTFDNSIELGVAGFTECTPSVDGPGVNFWGFNIQPYQGSKYIGFHYPEIFSIDLGSSPTVAGVPYVINIATTVASITPWSSNFPAQVKIYASNGCAQTQYVGTTTLRPNQAAGWLFELLEFVPNSAYSKLVFVAEAPSNPNVGYILVDNVTFRESICDTDGDGIPNSLDPDSDGDGCSDALEAGSTTNTTPGYTFTGPYGANGLANSLETSSESGTVNYFSTYDDAVDNTTANCTDTDVDGIADEDDIDDDNDGVVDANESPSCFFTASDWNTMNKSSFVTVTSDLLTLAPNTNFAALTDNNGTTGAIQFANSPAQNQLNKEVFRVAFSQPLQLDALYIRKTNATQILGGNVMLQASNDGNNWVNLLTAAVNPADATNVTANGAVTLANSNKFTVQQQPGLYTFYRIYGVASANVLGGIASELYFDVYAPEYVASFYPKSACTIDTDGDGIVNHLDPDSDGDGCSDAFEAGATASQTANYAFSGPYGTNGLVNSLETSPESGVVNYTSLYNTNALNTAIAICTDPDTDGDGETDSVETANGTDPADPCSYTNAPVAGDPVWATWSVLDCDGDGDNNGTDPDPLDPCVPGTGTPDPANAIWAAADCDEDGETNGEEDANGTDPADPCSYTNAPVSGDPAYTAWSVLDCDGDGDNNGTDPDPLDPCAYAACSTPDPNNTVWAAADCDEDGETNGEEDANGTDPADPCSYTNAPVLGDPAYTAWSVLDCDGDGDNNGTDPDPLDPCAYAAGSTPDVNNTVWAAADCDEDGETNGEEDANGTDPADPCSYTNAP